MTTLPPDDQSGQAADGQAPQQPVPPQPQAPQGGYQQPGPPQAPQQPGFPQDAYQQQGAYQQPAPADPVSNITLNYWLSVFFTWIPALIFYLIEKDRANPLAVAYHRENLNFSLVRTIAYVAIVVVGWIPYIGWLIALVLWIGQIVLFVFHIMAAVKAPDGYRRGEQPSFVFNLPLIK